MRSGLTYEQEAYRRGQTEAQKRRVLAAKRTVDFIRQHPEGVTREDFKKAGVPILGIELLQKHKLIIARQVREPERGSRAYRWVWYPVS